MISQRDLQLIEAVQQGLPVTSQPYADIGSRINMSESLLLNRLNLLLEDGILTRFSPMYHAEQMDGELTLAAIRVPQDSFDDIATIINSFPEVAHNYARDHEFSMWFVIATETPGRVKQVITEIEYKTGLNVYNMPKLQEYFVHLQLQA